MSRKAEAFVIEAFMQGIEKDCGYIDTDGSRVFLHTSEIIRRGKHGVEICVPIGWNTTLTRRVLSTLPDVTVQYKAGMLLLGHFPNDPKASWWKTGEWYCLGHFSKGTWRTT